MRNSASRAGFKHIRALIALASLTLLSGCSSEELTGIGFTENTSSVNQDSFVLWQGAWLAAAIVGAFTLILILWPAM
ncbi:MAG: hypothetical protein ACKN96_07655, partial [Actinomycetota bacterium]